MLNKPETTKRYKNKIETEETIVEYASRVINEVINNYPCFANTTRFDVDTARVVALDLNDVVDVNNPQQTSLFYQIARMVGVKKISLTEQDISLKPSLTCLNRITVTCSVKSHRTAKSLLWMKCITCRVSPVSYTHLTLPTNREV